MKKNWQAGIAGMSPDDDLNTITKRIIFGNGKELEDGKTSENQGNS